MEYNPFSSELSKLNNNLTILQERKKDVLESITCHENTDIESLNEQLQHILSELEDKNKEIEPLKANIRGCKTVISGGQGSYRDHLASYEQKMSRLMEDITPLNSKKESIEQEIKKHQALDVERGRVETHEIDKQINSLQSDLNRITEKKERVDRQLLEITDQIRNCESKINDALRALERAKTLDHKLTNAQKSRDRRMIHQTCENEFGIGAPFTVINELTTRLKPLQRDLIKLEERATIAGKKAARFIKTLIIDGNNMCYEGENFIGLAPLHKATRELEIEYDVIVVFDPTIQNLTNSMGSEIKKTFSKSVKVHVVANKQTADETILDLASADPNTYIISNDRFGEFNEKEVVKNNRIIRHEVVHNRVLIKDLSINTPLS